MLQRNFTEKQPIKKTAIKVPSQGPLGTQVPTLAKAQAPTDYSKDINKQFDLAQGKLGGQRTEAVRSTLENAQRIAAMRGTSGAGFETKLRAKAVAEAEKPYNELSTGLETERTGQLIGAKQAGEQMKEGQRQFDFSAGLQKFIAANEMDINKFSTFVNASTALKEAGLNNPTAWNQLFKSGVFQSGLSNAGIKTPNRLNPNDFSDS